ncbi:FtsX-like permease family protein [Gorillibacterium sp. sgz5001074]|uniref:ABC transporter permease n=1 Tax=Gorillibacterium sp. sgz5001074 TaxID=3446695 RepID=UPI003F676A7F
MALARMLIRKMVQNKWLELSLLMGLVLTVALAAGMPVYTEAMLTRMLVKDLERMEAGGLGHPGVYQIKAQMPGQRDEQRPDALAEFESYLKQEAEPGFTLPVKLAVTERETWSFEFKPVEGNRADAGANRLASFTSMPGLADHIRLLDGRLPSGEASDGVWEVLVTEKGLSTLGGVIGSVFEIKDKDLDWTVRFKAVGVFTKKSDDDLFFRDPSLGTWGKTFFIDDKLFEREFLQSRPIPLGAQIYYYLLDYTKLEVRNLDRLLDTDRQIREKTAAVSNSYSGDVNASIIKTVEKYPERASNLRTLVWSLNTPVLVMLGIYMFMVSHLISERQKTEIAVLRSRGASRLQIMASSAAEGLILCGLAFAAGPYLGLLLTRMLGASNGFLEFVSRASLTARLNGEAYRYAGLAAGASLIILLIPVFLATRVSIVGRKTAMARAGGAPVWHRFYLDVAVTGVALYGLRLYHNRLKTLKSFGLNKDMLQIDPLQFVVPALFILGAGLLLLRLYPYLIRLIYWAGRRWWPPSLYATLIQLGRSGSQYQFLMVFLIMTVATGVFSASAARTINSNVEDRTRYMNGAELVLDVPWQNDAPPEGGGGPERGGAPAETAPKPSRVHYLEPPFGPYAGLPGVEKAARVFVKKNAFFQAGKDRGQVTLMGIQTDEFSEAAWFRNGLTEYPMQDYLNVMAEDPRAVLVSRSVAEQKGVKLGDPIWIGWDGVDSRAFVVYGILDYFPSFNPLPASFDSKAKDNKPMLIVGHLRHIQTHLALEPYSIWLKLSPGASVKKIYEAMTEQKLEVAKVASTRDDLIRARNDPFLMAVNGVMTMGFLISVLVSFVGFLLYWILTLSGRALQTGILRAIGMRLSQLIGMLGAEQLLTSGAAVAIGVLTGHAASRLYVPLFESAFDPGKLVPPFQVVFDPADTVRLYVLVGVMITLGLCILGWMLSRIRIHQALKLGED